jgi:outer membrane protein assembly factor BamB
VAVAGGTAVGVFHRALGGVIAWDRANGAELWRFEGELAIAINSSPVIADGSVFIVNGADEVLALDLVTGQLRWQVKLDPTGFDWGNATVGAPGYARGILVVPTLYRDLVALDATSGTELWRFAATPGPLRTTHYRGAREAGFEASPIITGDIVWAADTAGRLTALDLRSGRELWHTLLGSPVLAGLATSGDWLVVASYDGTVRAMTTGVERRQPPIATCVPEAGCCDARGGPPAPALLVVVAYLRRRRRKATSSATAGHAEADRPALQA